MTLTESEFNGLTAFLAASTRALTRQPGLSRLHNDQVGRLRNKIQAAEGSPELIRTERAAGYVFTAPVEVVR